MTVLQQNVETIEGVLPYKLTEALLLIDPFVAADVTQTCKLAGSLKKVKETFKNGLALESKFIASIVSTLQSIASETQI